MVGQVLCYVATVDGEWVALLGWASAALQVKARDAWIGWSDDQRHRRLRYMANNVRYCILPGWNLPNLASRVLALNTRRLAADCASSRPSRHQGGHDRTQNRAATFPLDVSGAVP